MAVRHGIIKGPGGRFLHKRSKIAQEVLKQQAKDIEIISPEEKRLVLDDFNAASGDYSLDKTIHRRFEEQVERPRTMLRCCMKIIPSPIKNWKITPV